MKRILLISVILAAMLLSACTAPITTSTPTTTPTPAPAPTNLTAQKACGIVLATIKAPAHAPTSYLQAEFNPLNRQWHVTAWSSKEDSLKYLGCVYIVDDATGKVLNQP